MGGGKKGKKLGGIGNLKGSLGGAREPVWDECIYAAGLVRKDARRAGGRCLTDLVCGEETVRACRQQISLGEHTLGSDSMGSKRNHRKKLLKCGEVCECGLGRAEASSQGSEVSSDLSGLSLWPQTVLELSLEQNQDLGAAAQSMERPGLQLERFSLC